MRRRSFISAGVAAPASAQLLKDLRREIDASDLVSSHEHLLTESERVSSSVGLFTLVSHYLINDAVSAGLPSAVAKELEDGSKPLKARWAAFEPYYRQVKFGGYGRAFRIALNDIYGIADLSAATAERADELIRERNKPGIYEEILGRRMKLRYGVLDDYWHGDPVAPDRRFFVLARKMDWFVTPQRSADLKRMSEVTGVEVGSLGGLKAALGKRFQQSLAAGMVSVKTTLAYQRDLRFELVSEEEAARDFDDLRKDARPVPDGPLRWTERPYRRLEDHMFHEVIKLCAETGLPVQVHTGIQAGNAGWIENTRPMLLLGVIARFPGVKFDLFHIGYPYHQEVAALAKMYPNVTADFCWAHILSPATARAALGEMLDAVPVNKILGFGGDYRYAELSYGHSVIARDNIATVLAAKVEQGWCGENEAAEVGRALLAGNAARLFPRKGA